MSKLIKVILRSTSGDETSGRAAILADSDVVVLPSRLVQQIESSKAAGEAYVLAASEDGYEIPLVHVEAATFRLNRQGRARKSLWSVVRSALLAPTRDQRQQYGRFAHTLSAAALIGAASYFSGSRTWTLGAVFDVATLIAVTVVLFVVGAVLSKGD